MKRMLSLILTVTMLLTSFPLAVLAEGDTTPVETQQTEAPQETQAPEPTPRSDADEPAQPEETASEAPAPEPQQPDPTPEATAEPTAAPRAALAADATSLAFDALVGGYETVQPLTFTLRNTGDADAALRYGATDAFAVAGASTLAAGASTTVTVSPVLGLDAGEYRETLTIGTDDGSEASVSLSLMVEQAMASAALPLLYKTFDAGDDPLPAPTNFTATVIDYNAVQLDWDDVDGAVKYRLTYSTERSGDYTLLSDVVGTNTYTVRSSPIVCGTIYYFKICAYASDTEPGTLSATVSAWPRPIAPAGLTAVSRSMRSNRISWTPNTAGTTGYKLYLSTDEYTYTYLTTITSRSTAYFDHTALMPGTTYFYRITTYLTVNGITKEGAMSETIASATPEIAAVTGFTATSLNASSLRLTWDRQSDVTGYRIRRRLVRGGAVTGTFDIPMNTTVTMDDTGLRVGTNYYYTIEPYYIGTSTVYGPETEAVGVPKPVAPSTITAVSAAYNKVRVSWSAVSDADGYRIYRRDLDETAEFAPVGSTTGLSFLDDNGGAGLVTGYRYEYKITSFCIIGSLNVEGAISTRSAVIYPKPDQVVEVGLVHESYNSLTVNWSTSAGADSYIVECGVSNSFPTSTTVKVITADMPYTFTGLTCGRLYYFRVTSAVTDGAGVMTKGTASETKNMRPLPATPTDLAASYTSSSNVRLEWGPVSQGASGYVIWRSTLEDTGYAEIGKVTSGGLLYYVNSGLVTAQTYYYKVSPYVTYSGSNYYGKQTDYVSIKALPGKPVISSVASAGSTSLKVTWGAVSGAGGYALFYSDSAGGPFTSIDIPSGSTTTYTMKDLVETERDIYVKLQAYVIYNSIREVGVMSDPVVGSAKPGKVSGLTVTPGDENSMVLTWTTLQSVGNMADGYYVFRCQRDGSDEERIADVVGGDIGTYTDPALEVGEYYYYYVTAYAVGVVTPYVEGPRSDIRGALITPNVPQAFAVAVSTYNSNLISWEDVTGADGYEIFFSTDNVTYRSLVRIDDSATTSHTHLNLTPGKLYYYRMRSFKKPTDTSYLYSSFTATLSCRPRPLPPTDVDITVDTLTGHPKLTWTRAEGATGYVVYYDVDADGAFVNYRTVTTNATGATITGLTVGRTYYFKVKSRVVYNGTSYTSETFSDMVSGTVAPAKPTSVTATTVNYNTVKLTWPSVSGALGYYVYVRTDEGDDVYAEPLRVVGTNTKTISDDLISGRYLNDSVTAYCKDLNTGDELESIESPAKRFRVRLSAPTKVAISNVNTTTASITWAAVTGAMGYRVSRKLPGEAVYTELALYQTPGTFQHYDRTLAEVAALGDRVYYRVEAWIEKNEVEAFGAPSAAVSINRLPPTPMNLTAEATDFQTIDLEWEDVDWEGFTGTHKYQIQRSTTSATANFVNLTDVGPTITAYTNSNRNTGTTYYYRVRTYIIVGGVRYYSPFSTVSSAKPQLEAITDLAAETAGTGKVRLTWTGVAGMSGIYVYRRVGTSGSFVRIALLKAGIVVYTNSGLLSDQTYQYKLLPYRRVGATTVTGPYSNSVQIETE
jgi:hypothetical protein